MLTTGLFTRGWPLTPSQNKEKPALKLCGGSSMHFTERPNICLCSDEEQELKLLTKSVTNFSCAQIWVKIPQRAELVSVGMQHPTFWADDRDACPCDSEIQPSPPQVHWCFCCKFQAPPPQVPLELFQPAPTLPTQLLFTTVLFSPFLGWQKVQGDPHWGAESYADTFRGFCHIPAVIRAMQSQDFSGNCLCFAQCCFKPSALSHSSLSPEEMTPWPINSSLPSPWEFLSSCAPAHLHISPPLPGFQGCLSLLKAAAQNAVTHNTRRLETQVHLLEQQHFVFIRSSHGNITQSS